MRTAESIKQIIERRRDGEIHNAIIETQGKEAFVRASLPNPAGDEDFDVILHPMIREKGNVIRFLVPRMAEIHPDSRITRLVAKLNCGILIGSLGIDEDGEVRFQYHLPVNGLPEQPDDEIICRVLDVIEGTVPDISIILLHATLVESGLPENVIKQVLDKVELARQVKANQNRVKLN